VFGGAKTATGPSTAIGSIGNMHAEGNILIGVNQPAVLDGSNIPSHQRAFYTTSRPKPKIILEWFQEAQGGRFILSNRGDADATNINVSNLVSKDRWLRWITIDRIRHGNDVVVEIWTISAPKGNGEFDGIHHVSILSPDRGRHQAALEWLVANSPELAETSFIYEGEVEITCDGDDGVPAAPARFLISFDLVSKRVSVLPKRPTVSPDLGRS